MSRYIDADKLKQELDEWAINLHKPTNLVKDDTFVIIDEQPAADVVEVVRCKDCKYSQFKDNGVLRPTAYCHRLNVIISGKGKGYCYLAERKDGDEHECK